MTLQTRGGEEGTCIWTCGVLTVLDEGLRAGKPAMSGCHVEGGLVVLTLSRWSQRGRRKVKKKQ